MTVIAVLCSDIHLSEKPPTARSAEPDWFAAQLRALDELRSVAEEYDVPVVCAGDVFDAWKSNPSVINFALDNLPTMYACPGQHDLPNHSMEEIERSAYWTLVIAGVIKDIDVPSEMKGFVLLHGFPWGKKIEPVERSAGWINLAVIHRYVYTRGRLAYPGAPKEQRLAVMAEQLAGYDAAVFGDNHSGFVAKAGDCNVINTGCLIRRKQDERDYRPQVGLLNDDGTITQYFLDTSQDKWADPVDVPVGAGMDASEFLDDLKSLGADSLDFRAVVKQRLDANDADPAVRRLVQNALG